MSTQQKLTAAFNTYAPVSVTLESGITIDGHVYALTRQRFYMADRFDQDWEVARADITAITPFAFNGE